MRPISQTSQHGTGIAVTSLGDAPVQPGGTTANRPAPWPVVRVPTFAMVLVHTSRNWNTRNRSPPSGMDSTTGPSRRSSHALQYNVSTFGATTRVDRGVASATCRASSFTPVAASPAARVRASVTGAYP